VRDLLMLARLETESAPWDEEPIDVSQLCERIVEQMMPLAHERGLSIALDIEPGLIVVGSFDHLLRALLNLLDNAIKYAAPGGQIAFDARRLDGTCRIRVSNDGGPLDAALVARVGDRFLRGDSGRSSDTGGVGLGLAIAAEIARRHYGSLTLAGKSGGGAVAALILPLAPAKILEPKRPAVTVRA
jgi:signal transduction histidine kinase